MRFFQSPNFLRNVLLIDATTCVITGALMTLGSGVLTQLTSIPRDLLLYAGLSLFPIAAFMAVAATRAALSSTAVWLVILGNVAWVAGSLWLLVGGTISPNAFGFVFIAAQAVAVAVLAELEVIGVRRLAASPVSA